MRTHLLKRRHSHAIPLMDRVEDGLLPLINLVFLLLTFFLVAGAISQGKLPPLPDGPPVTERELPAPDLTLTPQGQLQLQGREIALQDLGRALPAPGNTPLRLAAARQLSLEHIETVLAVLELAGHDKVVLLTEPAP